MTAFVDTSVLIDYLRGQGPAARVLEDHRAAGPLHASEITRLEVLAGMRPVEENATRSLLSTLIWHPVDAQVSEAAGALGRRWLPSHHSIDSADLANRGDCATDGATAANEKRSPLSYVSGFDSAVLEGPDACTIKENH